MGLDAVVYKNSQALLEAYGLDALEVDQETGEAYPRPGVSLTLPKGGFVAAEERLGNIAHVGRLRELIEEVMGGTGSFILKRVLYSGSHSGDTITLSDIPRLKDEISRLEDIVDSDVAAFAASMKSLVSAAETEHNPIVFV